MSTQPLRLGVVFGSRSVEHEVSIITACQMMKSVDRSRYQLVPLYIDKQGRWWTGERLSNIKTFQNLDLQNPQEQLSDVTAVEFSPDPTKDHGIDVAIFCLHGGFGEDGTMAGLFELANIPYAAPGVVAAAVAIDKLITKHVAHSAGISIVNYRWFTRQDWAKDAAAQLANLQELRYPLFVKPASLGSSVGVTRVNTEKTLRDAIELALSFDTRILVEEGAQDCIEVNVAITGTEGMYEVSQTEQPIQTDEFLSYADKYERGGGKKAAKGMASLSRRIPAPISPSLSEKIQNAARQMWHLIDGTGVARIDFFANPSTEEFYLGEINCPPGSMAFYLWEASGKPYPQLVDDLVAQAQKRATTKKELMHSISSNILQKQSE